MKGLILKDLYNMKKSYLAIMGILCFVEIMSVIQGENFLECIPILLILVPVAIISNMFGLGNRSKWENYAMTMPLTKKDIIRSRYLIIVISTIGIAIITGIFNMVIGVLNNQAKINGLVQQICLCMSMGIIICSIMLPIVYKWGLEKMRILYIAFMFVGTFFISQITENSYFIDVISQLKWLNDYIGIIFITLSALAYFISYIISIKIYEKKNFS